MKPKSLDTSDLLSELKTAKTQGNGVDFGKTVTLLRELEPDRWITYLVRDKIIPHPLSSDFASSISFLFTALGESLKSGDIDVNSVHDLLSPVLSINACFSSIRERLDRLNVWGDVGIEIVCRVAAFLEDQASLALEKSDDFLLNKKVYLPHLVFGDNVPTYFGGVNTSRNIGFESIGENLQLILAYTIQKYSSRFQGKIFSFSSPYEDEDFSKLLLLASAWRQYEFLWEAIVFSGWGSRNHPQIKNVQVYEPPNIDEFMRYKIAGIRREELISESSFASLSEKPVPTEAIKKVANELNVPNFGELWDGKINNEAFKEVLEGLNFNVLIDFHLEKQHFDGFINDVQFGDGSNTVNWPTYITTINILSAFCITYDDAVKKKQTRFDMFDIFDRLLVVEKSHLIRLVSNVSNLAQTECSKAIEILTFNQDLRQMEIWDTPLIPVDTDKLLIVPSLIQTGDRIRAIENAISEWNNSLFQKRGELLENSIREFLLTNGIPAQTSVKFYSKEKEEVECDLVVFWDDYLLFIEAKSTKSVIIPSEIYRARSSIEKAVDQLNFREKAALENWIEFRNAAVDLDLPRNSLEPDKIKKIAVTNVLPFTGLTIQDVMVTDEQCFRRFFGEADIEVIPFPNSKGVESLGSIGRVRKSEKITADEFFLYLKHPPQVEIYRRCFERTILPLPKIKDTDPSIGMFHFTYHPERLPFSKALKKIVKPAKKRKRHKSKKRKE